MFGGLFATKYQLTKQHLAFRLCRIFRRDNGERYRMPTMKNKLTQGYTLIELVVAVGLFALIMTLVSGAYIMMISINRQAQGISTGIDNLSFALETMTRTIRTGTNYNDGVDCLGCTSFSVYDTSGTKIIYTRSVDQNGKGTITQKGISLTDPSVNVTDLKFYVSGTTPHDASQPHVTIVVSGIVSSDQGKTESFTVETGATMRLLDL